MLSESRLSPKVISLFRLTTSIFYLNVFIYSNYLLGNRLKFLTFWNVMIQCIYFGFGSIMILNNNKKPSHFWRCFEAGVVFPISFFVFFTFWGLYIIDRELIFPKRFDAIIPAWLNHSKHTAVLVTLLIDRYIVKFTYPENKHGLKASLSIAFAYLICLLLLQATTGSMVYPILNHLDLLGKTIFLTACLGFIFVSYFVGKVYNQLLWGDEIRKVGNKEIKCKIN